ncbi:hypothetical protein [Nitrosomonas sp. ANs5]|uniref:hypothetical protein n=1 Tax=Nitrosomonas sp. ANs5 TaxID=3423941 RepID=UPI003D33F38A
MIEKSRSTSLALATSAILGQPPRQKTRARGTGFRGDDSPSMLSKLEGVRPLRAARQRRR